MRIANHIGTRLGQLVAYQLAKRGHGAIHAKWVWKCKCGRSCTKSFRDARVTPHCGCMSKSNRALGLTKHGHAKVGQKSKIYFVWSEMVRRCNNPKNRSWKNYGGRGIAVCERWLRFENFLIDMGEKPDGLTIERVNNDGDYEKSNCKWATRIEQAHNKRNKS